MALFRRKADPDAPRLGIYIHIPFCVRKCDYCDFYSVPGRDGRMDEYLHALEVHIAESAPQAELYTVNTIYFGGGTPTFFGAERLARLLQIVRFAQATQAFQRARDAGFDNISLDLIYGLPDQTMESWKESVEALLKLNPEHLSCYGLKLEQGTPLYERREQEQMADDDTQADMYLWMVERLKNAGYGQYEISNFARPGRQSRHNLKYWMGEEYIGFGPSAHSYFGQQRYSFVRDLDAYVKGVLYNGKILDESTRINRREMGKEYLMLRMRTIWGVEENEYRERFYLNFRPLEERFREYESYGWAECTEGRWHFTPSGFLLSNPLIGDALAIQAEAARDTMRPIIEKRMEAEKQGQRRRVLGSPSRKKQK